MNTIGRPQQGPNPNEFPMLNRSLSTTYTPPQQQQQQQQQANQAPNRPLSAAFHSSQLLNAQQANLQNLLQSTGNSAQQLLANSQMNPSSQSLTSHSLNSLNATLTPNNSLSMPTGASLMSSLNLSNLSGLNNLGGSNTNVSFGLSGSQNNLASTNGQQHTNGANGLMMNAFNAAASANNQFMGSMSTLMGNVVNKNWSSFSSLKENKSPHEFQIQQEDFPALPRTQTNQPSDGENKLGSNLSGSASDLTSGTMNSIQQPKSTTPTNTNQANSAASTLLNISNANNSNQTPLKREIQIYPDGRIKNVPSNMLLDQFGVIGLLAYFKEDREKDIFSLALGSDLTALGLNLNSNESLYHSFLSPFSEVPSRLQDIDYPVPSEYIVNYQIKDKLAKVDMNRYHEDLLFYLFYTNGGDMLQLQAATALYERDWRFHVDKRVWLTKVQGLDPQQKTSNYEKGYYVVFDVSQWKRIQTEMTVEYIKLAENPMLANQLTSYQSSAPFVQRPTQLQ